MRIKPVRSDGRYAARRAIAMTAQLRRYGSQHRFSVAVRDFSMTGFRCETSFGLNVGEYIALIMPGFLPLEAQIVWADGDRYGCAFGHALHVAVYDHIVRQHRTA